MTSEHQQPKEHCEHEVVCRHHFPSDYAAGISCKEPCKHDTRSRPAPALEHCQYDNPEKCLHVIKMLKAGVKVACENQCPHWIEKRCRYLIFNIDNEVEVIAHDAAIRREEREKFAHILEKLEDDLMKQIFLSGNRDNAHMDFERARESLREGVP